MKQRALRFAVYGAIGFAVGLTVALFDFLTIEGLLEDVVHLPLWQKAMAPGVGLVLAAAILRWPGRGAPVGTSEEFIRAYHDRNDRLRIRHLPARLLAGMATVGFGGSLGLEGPAIYAGSTIGASMQTRLQSLFADKDKRMLMVAGAAAGVAAIFKTPATAVLFALEVPYQGDVARRALLPALIASSTSFIAFVTVLGDQEPIFSIREVRIPREFAGTSSIRLLMIAALIGLLAGLGALLMSRLIKQAKQVEQHRPWWQRILAAASTLAAMVLVTEHFYDGAPLTLGPDGAGELFVWVASDPNVTIWLLVVLFAMRMLATVVTLGAGGVGGVFIPLAIQGIILGRIVGLGIERFDFIDAETAVILLPAIGLAAFLGAGYRTPLASVMFVAESTGRNAFIVPALIAAAVAQVTMGGKSVSSFQKAARVGHLEERFQMSIGAALNANVSTVVPSLPLDEFVWNHALARGQLATPVVDEGKFVGTIALKNATGVDQERWPQTKVGDVMQTSPPTARLAWSLRDASRVMEQHHIELLAVVDAHDRFLGIVTNEEIVRLDVIVGEVPPQLS